MMTQLAKLLCIRVTSSLENGSTEFTQFCMHVMPHLVNKNSVFNFLHAAIPTTKLLEIVRCNDDEATEHKHVGIP
jgi:hypothetical protein